MTERNSIYESVFNGPPQEDLEQTLATAHDALAGPVDPAVRDAVLEKVLGGLSTGEIPTFEDVEKPSARAVCEVLDILNGELESCTTLADWPLYQMLYERYPEHARPVDNALMIGALMATSARSFDVLAREVYGAKRSLIVDIDTLPEISHHGTFVQADGTRLPFRDGSIDLVHTSQLIHMLRAPGAAEFDSGLAPQLFSEIGRVLRPDGQLLMRERVPDSTVSEKTRTKDSLVASLRRTWATKRFGAMITRNLARNGFSDTEVLPAFTMANPDFLFDPERNHGDQEVSVATLAVAVYARKAKG